MHLECFEVWKKKNFRKVLRNAMKKLKALSKDEKIRSSLSTVTDHEEAKERVMSLLEDAGFIVCTEVLMPRYRQDLIDYILHGTSPLMRSRRIFGTLPRLDLVGLLVFNGYRDPSLVLGNPQNNSFGSATNIFYYTPDDNLALENCSLYINSGLNQTNDSLSEGDQTTFTINNMADGQHSWYIICYDSSGNFNTSETRYLNAVSYTHLTLPTN